MNVVLQVGVWFATVGCIIVLATALAFYTLKRLASIRGSPSWEAWLIEHLAIAFIIGVVIAFTGSLVLAVDRIVTLIV